MQYSPLLILHIFAGIAGLVSGAAAMSFRKGSERHRLTGNVFFVSMLALGASASYIAYQKNDFGNLVGGIFTFYLVGTAWLTARRAEGQTGVIDYVGLAAALTGAAWLLYSGVLVWRLPRHMLNGVPAGIILFLGSIALLCAVGDIRMLVSGGIFGRARIARHLWRMCFAFFIASGSFFIARQRIFPMWVRKAYIPELLGVLPLLLMIFWLLRVRVRNLYGKKAIATAV